ncbi:hypothetical protein GOODEAATRI_006716, partial [Goodea atripinnis]
QMVATMGQITERMTESLNSLQKIQESLHSLSGPDVATVLAKLKELCRQLHTEDEQVHRLLEDVQVLASIASPGSLQSLSVSGIQLEEKVRNTHQLFSEVEEQTERNIRHLDTLQTEKEQLEKWLHEAAENALKQSVLLEQSCELVEQYQNFYTNIGGGSEEAVLNATTEAEDRLEELRVTGDTLSQRLRQEACYRVEELQHQAEQLPSLFPWPGTAERAQACLLARQLQTESDTLKVTLINLDKRRMDLAEKTRNAIWKDASWDELDTHWSVFNQKKQGYVEVTAETVGGLIGDLQQWIQTVQVQTSSSSQEYRQSVQEQVAAIQSNTTKNSDPNTLERAEGEWSSALLDASATVQVKAAQLDQVKKYHMQKKINRVFLEVIRAEKEKISLLSGLWADVDGLLAHKKATCWELEEIIHERTSSNEELSTIQANLEQTCADLEKQKFHLTKETLSIITHLEHILIKHQWEVQELQHCQEDQRNSVLCSIGELQDKCKVLRKNAVEQDRYLHLIGQMEGSMDIAKRQIQEAKKQSVSMAERFKLCQTLLVELALVNTQCQEAADQLEAIADELHPSELNSEREMLHHMVTTFNSLEHSVTDDIKDLEAKMLPGLQFTFELPALMELLQRAKGKLGEAKQVKPDEKAIDNAMLQCWVIRRNVEAGMRVLEGLAQKESVNLEDHSELYSLRDAVMEECHSWTVS